MPEGASWSDDVAQGIFRSADLEVYPAVYVSDAVVRTSVEDKELSYDVSLTNATPRPEGRLAAGSWDPANGAGWRYPELPARDVIVPAGSTTTVTVAAAWRARRGVVLVAQPPVPGRLPRPAARPGRPPRPPRTGHADSTSHVRFGFRESGQAGDHFELNGRRINFRGDSLQGANYDNIDHHGVSDAYDTLPGLPRALGRQRRLAQGRRQLPAAELQRVRIHQLPATPYMLDVADEKGLMIIDEPGIRGSNNRQNFVTGRDNMVKRLPTS